MGRHDVPDGSSPDILVTGATGFIGSRLISHLASSGYSVRGMSRRSIPDAGSVEYVQADVFDEGDLLRAMMGIHTAYYLIHSMEGVGSRWEGFAARERVQAQNFVKAAARSGVKRIIYLGGLVNESLELSMHMRSRRDVGRILGSGGIPVTELRASIIIGAQGGSYAMLRYLVERLPVMVCPSWVKSLAQPIAVSDVIEYLAGCLEKPETAGRVLEIGGPERLTYEDLMRVFAGYLGRRILVLQIPFLTTRLSSYWVDLITPVKASLARPLIDSLVHDSIVTDDSIRRIIPIRLTPILESIDTAAHEIRMLPRNPERREKTGFGINQRIIQISLIAMILIGTSYYWLDDRSEVYMPLWMAGSIIWNAALVFAMVCIRNKTRLGYMVAGIVSWVTLPFWLLDNYGLLYGMPVVASMPSDAVSARNVIGACAAALAIAASHNLFHKVADYQRGGRPV